MFEIGKRYEFKMIIDGDETTFWGVVETYEHPMLKLADAEVGKIYINTTLDVGEASTAKTVIPGKIINVTSPHFISAELDEKHIGNIVEDTENVR